MKLRNLVFPAATTLALLAGTCALAQTSAQKQQESVVEAARQSRAQKASSKPAKIFTDDDVANLKGTVSVVGSAPAPAASDADKGVLAAANAKPEVKDEPYWRKRFADARKTLADDSRELDLMQREFNLKQQQFYSDPTAALKEQYSREDLNKTQDAINAKKQAVDKDKQAVSALEDELRQSGGDASWANEQPLGQSQEQQQEPKQDQPQQQQQDQSQQQPPQQNTTQP